ncbi:MAG: solute-binding protein, partial [Rhodococcus sp.]|nr:solute-binding protein [Rhodococcus sp. (in: high G+C Gram-positive bacteria)]
AVPAALADIVGPGISWRDLTATNNLALPLGVSSSKTDTPSSSSTLMALDAVAAAITESPGPLTPELAQSFPVRDALMTMGSAYQSQGGDPNSTAALALAEVAAGEGPQVMAVTEQTIHALLRERPDAQLTSIYPLGATPIADYPAAVLREPGTGDAPARAASQFVDYVLGPQYSPVLTADGFRTPDLAGTALMPVISAVLPAADGDVLNSLADAARDPISAGNSLIVLDLSSGMSAHLDPVTAVLTDRIGRSPGSSSFGLITASSSVSGDTGYLVAAPLAALAAPSVDGLHVDSLTSALGAATATGKPTPYAGLVQAYENAVDGYVAGRSNKIVLITDGSTDTSAGIDRNALLTAIGDAADPSKPVTIDVIVVSGSGNPPNTSTLSAVASLTGGTLERVDSSDDAALVAAVNGMLP